jgi:hypothetical protein
MTASEAGRRILAVVESAGERLSGLTETRAGRPASAGKWSPKEILGHLIDSAANNHQRFVRAQLAEELVFPGYSQMDWVSCQGYAQEGWEALVQLWSAANRHLAHVVARIPAGALERPCRIGGGAAVTLGFLVDDYIRHMEHHLEQIRP